MQRSLTVADVNFVSLQSAVFCVQCELLSDNNTPRCLACGSAAVLSLSRVLGGSLRGQQTAHLIADAELDRLVRSLLYTVPQVAEATKIRYDEYAVEFPAAATFSLAIACGRAIMDPSPCRIRSSMRERSIWSRASASSRKKRRL
jgi:hypothetical protein